MFNRFKNPKAFVTMFDERVLVEAKRDGLTIRGTFAACVFPGTAADPLASVSSETEATLATILIAKSGLLGWTWKTPPRLGDRISHDGKVYAVTKRDDFVRDHYHLEAKLVK